MTNRQRMLRIIVLFVAVGLAISGWFRWWWERYHYEYWPPWYGRGQNLQPIPYMVLVGPVKPDSGLPGIVGVTQLAE